MAAPNGPLWPLSDLARGYGYTKPDSLYQVLVRLGVEPVHRAAGAGGQNMYDAHAVAVAIAGRPLSGRGRPNRNLPPYRDLDTDEVHLIVQALQGVFLDAVWAHDAPASLAGEIADTYGDDEDGPDAGSLALAAQVKTWPQGRAFGVALAAACALKQRTSGEGGIDGVLARVGLRPEEGMR